LHKEASASWPGLKWSRVQWVKVEFKGKPREEPNRPGVCEKGDLILWEAGVEVDSRGTRKQDRLSPPLKKKGVDGERS